MSGPAAAARQETAATRVPLETLERFGHALTAAAGIPPDEAAPLIDTLLWCDLRGHQTQGFHRLPVLLNRLRAGALRSPAEMAWCQTGPSTGTLDARNGFGQVAGRLAMDHAVGLARETGAGIVAVRHSNHFGAAGYFATRAAEQGLLGLTYTNAMSKVAPHGGRHALLGTNPFAFSCPRRDAAPLTIDLATSATAGSLVTHARRTGQPLPEGYALDAAGNPTTDPNEAEGGGCLLPAAGAKGYCLGLLVEILSGVLTGAAVAPNVGSFFFDLNRQVDCGHLMVAIDIARFLPLEEFADRLEALLAALVGVAPREGFDAVRIPGHGRVQSADEHLRAGVPLAHYVVKALADTAHELGVAVPWEGSE